MKNTCKDCAFFDKFSIQKRDDNVIGACKANPPVPASEYAESKLGVWPTVLGSWWCGVWTSNEIKDDKNNKQ